MGVPSRRKLQEKFHGERHHFAHRLYSSIWQEKTSIKIKPPIEIGLSVSEWKEYVSKATGMSGDRIREIDHGVRHEVSLELGHERENITRTYLG